MLKIWVSKSIWYYSSGMLSQDVAIFPVSREEAAWNVWEILIERFVVLLYSRTGSTASVNDARCWLFTIKSGCISNYPPTLNALFQYIYRSNLQSSSWCQAWNLPQLLADWCKFGWDGASSTWMTIAEATKSCQKLVKCWCKKNCSGRCKCKKEGFRCTMTM